MRLIKLQAAASQPERQSLVPRTGTPRGMRSAPSRPTRLLAQHRYPGAVPYPTHARRPSAVAYLICSVDVGLALQQQPRRLYESLSSSLKESRVPVLRRKADV